MKSERRSPSVFLWDSSPIGTKRRFRKAGEAIGHVSLICHGELVLQIARGRYKCDPDRIFAVVPNHSTVGKHLQRLVGGTYPLPDIGLYDKRVWQFKSVI